MSAAPQPDLSGPSAPGLRFTQSEHLRILSRPDWVEQIVMFLKNKAVDSKVCDEKTASRLVVAMTEAITNAIVHGNLGISSDLKQQGDGTFRKVLEERQNDPHLMSKIVDIRIDYEPDRCVWTITDQGKGFDVDKAMKRLASDDPEDIMASGRGIAIMHAFVDEVNWAEGGRQIRLAIQLQRGNEKRKHARHKYIAPVAVTLLEDGSVHQGLARDLSAGGIAFVMDHPIPAGASASVAINTDNPQSPTLSGKIVRCIPTSGPFHDVAIQFQEVYNDAAALTAAD